MIGYEVTLHCDAALVVKVERWLRETHAPEMLALGYFQSIHVERDETRLRSRYQLESHAQLDDYFCHHAAAMRASFQAQFPSGVLVTRAVWNGIACWPESTAER